MVAEKALNTNRLSNDFRLLFGGGWKIGASESVKTCGKEMKRILDHLDNFSVSKTNIAQNNNNGSQIMDYKEKSREK